MRFNILLLGLVVLIFLAGCSSTSQLTTLKSNAENFENAGDHSQAFKAWKSYLDQTSIEEVTGAEFAKAAQTAYKAGQTEQAISWFDQARYKSFSSADMYQTLGAIYRNQDNISKELSALEYYTENYGTENSEVNTRLFSIYSEIDEFEKAENAWDEMSASEKNTENHLVNYLVINEKLENEAIADSVATEILKINPDQPDALERMAKKYYWAGQNRYDREMKAYEQNKTRKQYRILLEELDKVTADFKKALPYLKKLWKQNPGKEYAAYFANIYARFGNEEKAEYYKKYIKQ
ncbi:tetratricopeptide repeat protein [Maribellus mangrovi]|uniref:tetratricopeptide repeat protein n=1 Tax=Maribellus mangrovi TaxID=3133146 RepID=UPI0030EF3510